MTSREYDAWVSRRSQEEALKRFDTILGAVCGGFAFGFCFALWIFA